MRCSSVPVHFSVCLRQWDRHSLLVFINIPLLNADVLHVEVCFSWILLLQMSSWFYTKVLWCKTLLSYFNFSTDFLLDSKMRFSREIVALILLLSCLQRRYTFNSCKTATHLKVFQACVNCLKSRLLWKAVNI